MRVKDVFWIGCLILSNIATVTGKSVKSCTAGGKKCIFPFKYKGNTFKSCTTFDSVNGKGWCALKIDNENNVILGEWEDCDSICYARTCGWCGQPRGFCCIREGKTDCIWSKWSDCSKPCGEGIKTRSIAEQAKNGGLTCKGTDKMACNLQPCPNIYTETDCVLSKWSDCSKSCGEGIQFRSIDMEAKNGGQNGKGESKRACNLQSCPNISLIKDSGLWKPDASMSECGYGIDKYLYETKEPEIFYPDNENLDCVPIKVGAVGGIDASPGNFPWMVLLAYDPPGLPGSEKFYVCGGSLINKHYVLTAAHCIDTENGFPVEVVLGETIVGKDPGCEGFPSIMRIKISKENLIVHEDYSKEKQYANDIALIRLDKAVPLNQEDFNSSFINPICLPWSRG